MPNAEHDAACISCDEAVRVDAESPGLAVASLRAFFVRHEGCLTSVDLDAYRRMAAAHRSDAG